MVRIVSVCAVSYSYTLDVNTVQHSTFLFFKWMDDVNVFQELVLFWYPWLDA